MASIKERPGGAYLIRVSGGYTPQGKQKVHTMTWKAPAGMTPAKARKEAERQAILFEEQCKAQGIGNGHIKFETFARQWLKEYAERKLRPRTVARLHSLEDRTYQAIGHIYIDKLTARQVQAFIDNLGEDGISEKADRAEPKADLRKLLKAENMTQKDLADKAGISYSTASSLCRGESVTKATADKVAAALGRKDLFTLKKGAGRLAPKSIQHYLSFISSVMEYAYRFELVKANPCKRVVIPTGEKQSGRSTPWRRPSASWTAWRAPLSCIGPFSSWLSTAASGAVSSWAWNGKTSTSTTAPLPSGALANI